MSDSSTGTSAIASPDYHFGTEPNAFLKSQAGLLKPRPEGAGRSPTAKAATACGWPNKASMCTPSTFRRTASPSRGRWRRSVASRLRIEQADIHNWDWPSAAYDVIVVIFIQFSPPAERAKVFAGIRKALKPGGLLLMEGYRPEAAQIRHRRADARSKISTRESCWRRSSAISPRSISASTTACCTRARAMSACRR